MFVTLDNGQAISNVTVVKLRSEKTPFNWRISDTSFTGRNNPLAAISAEINAKLMERLSARTNMGETTSRTDE